MEELRNFLLSDACSSTVYFQTDSDVHVMKFASDNFSNKLGATCILGYFKGVDFS